MNFQLSYNYETRLIKIFTGTYFIIADSYFNNCNPSCICNKYYIKSNIIHVYVPLYFIIIW